MHPEHSRVDNTIGVFDTWTKAKYAIDRRETEAWSRGRATRRIIATHSVDSGHEDWNSSATTGLIESYNGEWNLRWVKEVAFRGL